MTLPARALTVFLIFSAWFVPASPASAGVTIHVATFDDVEVPCSLRSAVRATNQNANISYCEAAGSTGTDVIVLEAGTYRLTRSGEDDTAAAGDLDVTGSLVIRGAGAGRTIIDASALSPADRVFDVRSGASLTLVGLTVTGGSTSANGGGVGNSGSLALNRVIVRSNDAFNGGGIFHFSGASSLVVRNSAIVGNVAEFDGGGIGLNAAGVELTNVTMSVNFADDDGGGISLGPHSSGAELHSVTLARNWADTDGDGDGNGGGLAIDATAGNVIENTLFAENNDATAGTHAPDCFIFNADVTTNHNLVSDDENCNFPVGTANILNVAPRIESLSNNGGDTLTHALRPLSLAVGGGAGCPALDQRGAPRQECEIGAYERVLCRRVLVNRVGTSGSDRLVGTPRRDGLLGLGGSDVLLGKARADSACGGAGADTISGGDGDDRLSGAGGRDFLRGGNGVDQCIGGPGRDRSRTCEQEHGIP